MKNSHDVVDYFVEFNLLCGENIRVAILVLDDSCSKLPLVIDNYFKTFFSAQNLTTEFTLLPVAGIFKPFEQNTIQYGLFDISLVNGTNESRLVTNLSRIIITALQDDEIDDETIITFAFYLHVAVLKVSQDRLEVNTLLKNYYIDSRSQDENEISAEYILEKFENSRHELLDIYLNIMFENQSDLPPWMTEWIGCVRDAIEANGTFMTDNLQTEKYSKIISIVNRQLGISHNAWLLISCFLQHTSNIFYSQTLTHLK